SCSEELHPSLQPPRFAGDRVGVSGDLAQRKRGSAGATAAGDFLPGWDESLFVARKPRKTRIIFSLLITAANLVLHQTVERIHVGKKYGDIPRGIFVVRGENVVLLGEIDLEKESDTPLQQVSIEEILEEQRVEQQAKQESEKLKVQALKERGLSVPRAGMSTRPTAPGAGAPQQSEGRTVIRL
ncbi:PREDICTED: U6 snRNA-associated Sm-like protein LSm1, partial [Pterocles gutturalis]|uniref:U6 snRNA-associated Sm-like protein LSm1 n=1 Tax=Pterocles gutturalis TaxID=240206 RepID=UPI000528E88F